MTQAPPKQGLSQWLLQLSHERIERVVAASLVGVDSATVVREGTRQSSEVEGIGSSERVDERLAEAPRLEAALADEHEANLFDDITSEHGNLH